ncbi:SMI1/KNR4 family protein [Actinoallomurus sp. NPDC052274]|uniref:SMI1/KNR4 family protein n=1 Tax=Actinoallomurus sp. NPDC052274 TaxID=3155420 RepID=UPI003436CAED
MNPKTFSIEEFRDHLLDEGLVRSKDVVGCSEAEIDELMRVQRVSRIPGLYRDFLRVMGKSPYPLLSGTDWSYEDLLRIKESAREILAEDGADPGILDDALVIAMHQGYVIYYLPAIGAAGDDPGVWNYIEEEQPTNPWPTFRAFLLSLIELRREELGVYRDLEAGGRFTMTQVEENGDPLD